MSDIEDLRRQFYDNGDDPFSLAASSTSGSGSGSGSRARGGATSSSAARRNGRLSDQASSDRSNLGPGRRNDGNIRARGKTTETPFMAKLRGALDDDNDHGSSARRPVGSEDLMDVDPPRALPVDRGLASTSHDKESDIQKLVRAWQNERHAPDVLPACDELLGRVLDSIRQQTRMANTLKSADVTLSEEEHYCTTLVQTEVERIKFIVRSYVRTRLHKIEQYAAYITLNPSIHPRLTEAELRHAQRYGELVVSQFHTAVLGHLPEPQQGLDDDATEVVPSMVSEPDKSKPVFFHAFNTIEGLQMDDGTTDSVPNATVMLVPYRVIEQNLLRGEGELV